MPRIGADWQALAVSWLLATSSTCPLKVPWLPATAPCGSGWQPHKHSCIHGLIHNDAAAGSLQARLTFDKLPHCMHISIGLLAPSACLLWAADPRRPQQQGAMCAGAAVAQSSLCSCLDFLIDSCLLCSRLRDGNHHPGQLCS
jgi:hypothetical protein